jgi:hypothetical protein
MLEKKEHARRFRALGQGHSYCAKGASPKYFGGPERIRLLIRLPSPPAAKGARRL